MKKVLRKPIKLLLIVIVSIVGILSYLQYDNIVALIYGLNHSSEDIAEEMDDNREKLKSEVEKYTSEPIQDITAEDEEKLLKGEITIEEVADKYNLPLDYMKDIDENENIEELEEFNNSDTNNDNNQNNYDNSTAPDTKAIDDAISDGVSKMYALKAKYVNKLGELERKVYDEYTSLPKEKQNEDSKYKLVIDNIDYVAQLEEKCDIEVEKVLSTLKTELTNLNGDTDIIQILQDAYQEEKEVKKAYYLSLYNN